MILRYVVIIFSGQEIMAVSHGIPFQHAADLFGLRAFGNIYSRIGNPTVVRLPV